jgi:acid phosphatase (class A)
MKAIFGLTGALWLLCLACASSAQEHKAKADAKPAKVRVATFVHVDKLPLTTIIPPPPASGSDVTKAEFAELHRLQDTRTPEQVKAAQADDAEEDIFIYSTVLGAGFNAKALPLTAALSAHVHGDEPVASDPLKELFQRPRPYQIDATLHPVCKLTEAHNSYPSGHTLSGYLLALTLIEMVPETSTQILQRADLYAHNRLVCGVHTASDLEASRRVAYLVFGSIVDDPKFKQELAAARTETRHALGLTQ